MTIDSATFVEVGGIGTSKASGISKNFRRHLGSTQYAVALAIFAAIANGIWGLLDRSTPSWDQSNYLNVAWQYQQALDHHGVYGFVHSVYTVDPSQAPLFTVLLVPFIYIIGDGQRAGMLLNFFLSLALYLSVGEIARTIFHSTRARFLAISAVALMPLMIGLEHNVLQDFLLTTLATCAILLLLKTERFRRLDRSLLVGLVMGLGSLTKVTFPLFVIGPVLVIIIQALRSAAGRRRFEMADVSTPRYGTLIRNIVAALLVYLCVALAWYGPNFSATLSYVRSTTSGPLSLGAGPGDPFTFHNIMSFTLGMMNADVSWIFGLAAIAAAVLSVPVFVHWVRTRTDLGDRIADAALLLSWVLIPYLSVALAHNQDVRLMAPAMPGMAVVLAGLLAAVRWRYAFIGVAGATAAFSCFQLARMIQPVDAGFLPAQAVVAFGSLDAVIPFTGPTLGYEQVPTPDYGTPVIAYIESTVRTSHLERHDAPVPVCFLESEPIVNSNTLGFLAESRGDDFNLPNIEIGSGGLKALTQSLSNCEIALYVKQPQVTAQTVGTRLVLVNGDYAAEFMNSARMSLFEPDYKRFFVGSGEWVDVLVRK